MHIFEAFENLVNTVFTIAIIIIVIGAIVGIIGFFTDFDFSSTSKSKPRYQHPQKPDGYRRIDDEENSIMGCSCYNCGHSLPKDRDNPNRVTRYCSKYDTDVSSYYTCTQFYNVLIQ